MTELKSDCVRVWCHQWLLHLKAVDCFPLSLSPAIHWLLLCQSNDRVSLSGCLFFSLFSLFFVIFFPASCSSNLSPAMQIFALSADAHCEGKRKKEEGNLTDDISCTTIVCTGIYTRPLSLSLVTCVSCFSSFIWWQANHQLRVWLMDRSMDQKLTSCFYLPSLSLSPHYGISCSSSLLFFSSSPLVSSLSCFFVSPAAPVTLEKHFHLFQIPN